MVHQVHIQFQIPSVDIVTEAEMQTILEKLIREHLCDVQNLEIRSSPVWTREVAAMSEGDRRKLFGKYFKKSTT